MKYTKYVVAALLLFIVIKCFNSPKIPVNPTEGDSYKQFNRAVNEDEWYIGGDLHKKNISDWKVATEANKLATCGDFLAKLKKDIPLAELKNNASQLKDCIDEATKGTNTSDENKVSEIGALCLIMMGY